ncbi:MAG: putative inner membrane protein [Parcubacteria group bacterium ADurb.Bin115]|nr:MAG: putative inner membrane protein [Parcubacteria group bacterium ADurb.Bin115]HOD87062.1 AI-2E family transporter [bacterium]HQQ38617.1 AI-2E family transporter [bacterium]
MTKSLTKPFLLILLGLVLVGCYFIFKPFLTEILVAAILVSIFYTPYLKLIKFLKGRQNLAALLMCFFLVILIIIPTVRLVIYAGQQSATAYAQAINFFNSHSVNGVIQTSALPDKLLGTINFSQYYNNDTFKNFFLDVFKQLSNWLLSGATMLVKGTTNFIISLFIIIITMFFFFVDGKKMLERFMYLSPLPNVYDREIFQKFRAVSYTTILSTFVTAAAQGLVGAIGFAIVGFPAFLAGMLVALLSLLPYIGSMIFYVPMGVYYLLVGKIWQGIFILLWGMIVISNIDNIIRAYMIKGKAQVNPIFVVFSILGGIALFGFWGVVIGPLIISIAVTIFHIYELEFCNSLDDGCNAENKEIKIAEKKAKEEREEEAAEEKKRHKETLKKLGRR